MATRGPAIVFVADAGQYPRVRRLVHCIRERQCCSAELYCVDIGLAGEQVEALRVASVRVVKTIRGTPDELKLRQPFMHKAFADLYCPLNDPLIICDTDLDFRADGVLAALIELAGRKLFIAEEIYGWVSNLNVKFELDDHARVHSAERRAYLDPQAHLLQRGPIYNAGLFGGPRRELERFMMLAREMIAGTLDVYHWFWEQVAFSKIVAMGLFDVEVLRTEDNWITSWGDNPAARVLHFSGDLLCEHPLRLKIPDEYLRADPPHAWKAVKPGLDLVA